MINKIKDISQFSKLFKISIPVEEHFEYYINTLSNSFEFREIVSLVNKYADFEDWIKQNGFDNVGHYKMKYAYNPIISKITQTQAYLRCMAFDCSSFETYTKDHLKSHEENFLISLDFSSANFQTIKIFDYENEMGSNWQELCDSLNIHPVLAASKSYRQLVLGNLNPKKFQKISHYHIIQLAKELENFFPQDDIISVSHDELVINLGNNKEVAFIKATEVLNAVHLIKISRTSTWMEIKPTVFKMKKISKGIYTKTVFFMTQESIVEMYKTLFGCPGNLYYINFKKHILQSEPEDRDCFFLLDEKLAKWVI